MSKKIILSFLLILFLSATVFAGTLCMFDGNINFMERLFQMQISFDGKEKISTLLKFLANDNYYFNADLEHIKISNLDFSTKLESTGRLLKDGSGSLKILKGWFWSNYSLLNYKPSQELSGTFELDKKTKRLSIKSFAWGNIELSGSVDLIYPYNLDLILGIKDMEVSGLALFLGIPLDEFELEGFVNGRLKINGLVSQPQINGQIRVSQGSLKDFKYQDMFLNLEGSFPLLNIVDSGIIEEGGMPYSLKGRLDLSDLHNFNSQLQEMKISPSDEKGFNWQSWEINRKQMDNNPDSVKMEYKLKPNQPFGIRFEGNQEILGLEHKIKF